MQNEKFIKRVLPITLFVLTIISNAFIVIIKYPATLSMLLSITIIVISCVLIYLVIINYNKILAISSIFLLYPSVLQIPNNL